MSKFFSKNNIILLIVVILIILIILIIFLFIKVYTVIETTGPISFYGQPKFNIQQGIVSATVSNGCTASSNDQNCTAGLTLSPIIFPTAFTSVPNVIISINSGLDSTNNPNILANATIYDITNTSFMVAITNIIESSTPTQPVELTINWVAIGI